MPTDMNQKPASRRQVYAAIALLDLPMPKQVGVDNNHLMPNYVHLAFSSIDDGVCWAKHFGVDCAPYLHKGVRYLGASNAEMLGRPVALWATEDQTDPAEAPLDDATRAQLAQVAEPVVVVAGPDQPHAPASAYDRCLPCGKTIMRINGRWLHLAARTRACPPPPPTLDDQILTEYVADGVTRVEHPA